MTISLQYIRTVAATQVRKLLFVQYFVLRLLFLFLISVFKKKQQQNVNIISCKKAKNLGQINLYLPQPVFDAIRTVHTNNNNTTISTE